MTTTIVDSATGEIITDDQAHDLILIADGFRFGPTGLTIEGDPSFEIYQAVGRTLMRFEGAIQWWIGDWLNYGEHRWGEMYAQAVQQTSYVEGSLANMKWVADRVKSSSRNENLSYSHHVAVAPLPAGEQERWLDKAQKDGLSGRQLRRAIARPQNPPPKSDLIFGQIDHATRTVTLWPHTLEEITQIMDRLAGLVEWQ